MDQKFAASLRSLTFTDFESIFSKSMVAHFWELFQAHLENDTLGQFLLEVPDNYRDEISALVMQHLVPDNCEIHGPIKELTDLRDFLKEHSKPFYIKPLDRQSISGYADWAVLASAKDYQQFKIHSQTHGKSTSN